MKSSELDIIHNKKDDLKFYCNVGSMKGELNYELKESNIIDVYRTFVDPDLRGKGIAKELMLKLIEYAEQKKYKIYPSCSYAVTFFKVNKEFQYLLAPGVNLGNPGSCRLMNKKE